MLSRAGGRTKQAGHPGAGEASYNSTGEPDAATTMQPNKRMKLTKRGERGRRSMVPGAFRG